MSIRYSESQKVPSSVSLLARKDFGSDTILGEEKAERKKIKAFEGICGNSNDASVSRGYGIYKMLIVLLSFNFAYSLHP